MLIHDKHINRSASTLLQTHMDTSSQMQTQGSLWKLGIVSILLEDGTACTMTLINPLKLKEH